VTPVPSSRALLGTTSDLVSPCVWIAWLHFHKRHWRQGQCPSGSSHLALEFVSCLPRTVA
ncbi:MAG TPA: hypothetical protein PLY00_16505, partial [Verrucomicrobiota bacterium]|nr:hypothetical protein [Verrucomicrobiota bacterium]HOF49798.1 hypothetical protein [Verrucomicrobiota bacterium]HOG88492.1 hypothetical protein [Verrucomicrobiota bacterium]HOR72858.1 hypothetical protein [Verrucomicrobiota bacterium]HOU89188.1 hypothetical protein [Verrucomicrobiota bacterium]